MDDTVLNVTKSAAKGFSGEVYAQLKDALVEFAGDPTYEALDRYYQAISESSELTDKLLAATLLQHALDSLFQRRSMPLVESIKQNLREFGQFTAKLNATVSMLSPVAEAVPKIMHFVWVGGSEVGAIQRDYMNIWRKVLAAEGYRFNLWYDSDALLAFKMNRLILDSARAHAMESGGAEETTPWKLSKLIEERARVLKRQMWEYLQQPQWAGRADEARIDLMVRDYGQDRSTLEAFRQQCVDTHLAMIGPDLRLRDAGQEFQDHYLRDVYQREVAMRGNFAAASDVVRLQAVYKEGGRYSDMDYLPPLIDKMGGVDINSLPEEGRIGVLQQLLNHDDSLMPGRDRRRYDDRTSRIPVEHQKDVLAFALSKPGIGKIFVAPRETSAPRNGLRLGTALGDPNGREMNAHFLAQPTSAMIDSSMQVIRSNYEALSEVERRLTAEGTNWANDTRLFDIARAVIVEKMAEVGLTQAQLDNLGALAKGMVEYYQDGIRIGARSTVTMTGPSATATGLVDYAERNLEATQAPAVRNSLKLVEGYNLYTEEELISGWTVNGDEKAWLNAEHERWTSGKLTTRYKGNLSELLNEQTLTFKRGWPVIEGKPVLLTSVLQQLLNDLGEPFVRTMNDRLSGDVTFRNRFFIGPVERAQLRAQPDVELPPSIGAESLGNLNEAFSRMAAGKLAVEHLSPVHRVVLGGLFAATTLDDEGFAGAWEAARTLAINTQDRGLGERYVQLEQRLRDQSHTDFLLGFNTSQSPPSTQLSSRELRVLALNEPLSVRQWGERVRGVESAARREYRSSILQRGNPIRARMYAAGAISAKQLPQELLVRGGGDPGRRCYPLALVMAAALEQGAAAERALIGKLASANLAHDDPQTHKLLRVLDELRSFPMSQFGEKRGATDLPQVMQILEENASGANLMLNTDRHSLLVSKVVVNGQASYRFYDPNFGLYEFARVQDLQRGIEAFFTDSDLARLYGIEEVSSVTFDLLELNGSSIAAKPLPSQLTVGELLGDRSTEPWHHHAALRTRALSENARLGRAVAELEGHRWAQRIEQATRELRARHGLTPEYVPVYQTAEPAGEGKWTLSLINRREPTKSLSVTLEDPTWFDARNWLQEQLTRMGKELPVDVAPHEPAAIHTLNSGFAMMALMQALRRHEDADKEQQGAPMALAVRLHSYVIYSQLAHGVIADIVGVIKLVELALLDERLIATTAAGAAENTFRLLAVEGAGGLLALINVGFDIYELVTATDPTARTAAAVQLSFDLGTVALAGSALAIGGTFAAVAGPLSVIVGGVGFGLGALARNYSLILLRAQNVGQYIYKLRAALVEGGFTVQDGVIHPLPEAVIVQLDLRRRQITLGSHGLFRGRRPGPGLPTVDADTTQAIDMRERWGIAEQVELAEGIHSVILPCTPKCFFDYDYQLMPGGTHRHDQGFDEFRELEHDSNGERTFWFDPWTPCEYLVYKLFPVYKPSLIKVSLDEQCRSLYVPQMPREWREKISYEIEGVAGRYSLSLNEGVSKVDLRSLHVPEAVGWVIRATWLSEEDVKFVAQGLDLYGGIKVRVAPESDVILELSGGQLFQVDWGSQRLSLVDLQLPDNNKLGAVRERLSQLTHEHHLSSPYLSLHHLKVPFTDVHSPVYTQAYYEVAKERVLYVRDLPQAFNNDIRLAAVIGDSAFFYHPEAATVWRVEVVSAQVTRRYRLLDTRFPSRILSCRELGETLHVVQQFTDHEDNQCQLEYLIHPDSVELTAISVSNERARLIDEEKGAELDWFEFVSTYSANKLPSDGSLEMGGDIKTWKAATFISYQVHFGTRTYSAWRRSRDDWWINGKDLDIQNPTLVALQPDDSDSVLFYDGLKRTLWACQRVRDSEQVIMSALVKDVDNEQCVFAGHLVQTTPGLLFDVRTAPAKLCLLSEKWLREQPDWLAALTTVIEQHRLATLDIVGLSDEHGRPFAARYMEQQILLVNAEHGRDVRTLGPTADKQAAWLFAPESGVLLRQPLLSLARAKALFGTGLRLAGHAEGISPQPVWRDWSFAEVILQAGELQGRTREGVILALVEGEPARITGVDQTFIAARSSSGTLEERLQRLVFDQSHAPILTAGRSSSGDQWYDTVDRRLFSAAGRMDDQRVTYLGVLSDESYLLYDPVDQLLFSRHPKGRSQGRERRVWSHKISVYRDDQVLAIHGREPEIVLEAMLPEGINQLILGFGDQGMGCQVSQDDWARLDCIAVDLAGSQSSPPSASGELVLLVPELDNWWLSSGSGHLVLTDPDNAHTLIFRNALTMPATSRLALTLKLHLQGQYQPVVLEELVQAWQAHGEDGQVHLLGWVLDQSNQA